MLTGPERPGRFVPCRPLGRRLYHGRDRRDYDNTTFGKSDFRNIVRRFTEENRKANQALVDLVNKIAARRAAPGRARRVERERGLRPYFCSRMYFFGSFWKSRRQSVQQKPMTLPS